MDNKLLEFSNRLDEVLKNETLDSIQLWVKDFYAKKAISKLGDGELLPMKNHFNPFCLIDWDSIQTPEISFLDEQTELSSAA